ncbi:2-dehydropantoate 2-reductase [Spirochaeta cellobiosiphila]|uniref:2-dehydropantoate 2-reductase n=1 Tax=Spirochaeta cellobiosiphila TaxID=504483 RepID=UPI0003F6BBED|nr:2-dehydropantoate 2-reductase [Spirochaeta cellobiosiphila]
MTYAIIGTGAIGGYYGGKLANSDFPVTFVARSDYSYIKENGLKVDSPTGNFHLKGINVVPFIKDLPKVDVVIISTKTNSNKDIGEQLAVSINKDSHILLLQNGLGMESDVKAQVPDAHIFGGMCFICSQKRGPGYIVHLDKGTLEMAALEEADLDILHRIKEDFIFSGIECSVSSSLNQSRWKKLLWNIPYNGLSVVMNANTEQLMSNPYTSELIKRIMLEVKKGAVSAGCHITDPMIEGMLASTRTMTPYEPSMKLDYDNNQKMELHYMYHNPIKEASASGIQLPSVRMLWEQLQYLNSCKVRE